MGHPVVKEAARYNIGKWYYLVLILSQLVCTFVSEKEQRKFEMNHVDYILQWKLKKVAFETAYSGAGCHQ